MVDDSDWQAITTLPSTLSAETEQALARTDSFRERWIEFIDSASEEDATDRRDRNLRRHAIETGIIEKLYDVDWGVTEVLVAEGLTLDVAERDGDFSHETLATINAQLDGLKLLISYIQQHREFSTSFLRELHAAITATQISYEGRDQFGDLVQVRLERGEWKKTDNHVVRRDGSLLKYTPALFVQDEVDKLVAWYNAYIQQEIHPLALAAWLHHRFIIIHPFADGNGRVARALSLLVLLQKRYAPIVVRRDNREEYIEALDLANEGDLEPLIRFFARLEEYAIIAELETSPVRGAGSAIQVAQEYAKRLKAKFEFSDNERREGIASLNADLNRRINEMLTRTGEELKEALAEVDPKVDTWVRGAVPPEEASGYWRNEIIRAAREVDFYSNLNDGTWWTSMRVKFLGTAMRYVTVLQKVGHGETGIVALTFFAESFTPKNARADDEGSFSPEPLIRLKPSDSLRYLHNDEATTVWDRTEEAVNKTFTAAISAFLERMG